MTALVIVLAAFVAVTLGLHLASAGLTARRYMNPAPARSIPGRPLVSLIRPVCGLDRFDEETLGSSFRLSWRDLEVIFCAAHESDPAVPLVRRLIAENPRVNAQLLIGESGLSGNPKLNNLEKGWRVSRGAFVAMTNSNLLLPVDYIERLLWSGGLIPDWCPARRSASAARIWAARSNAPS